MEWGSKDNIASELDLTVQNSIIVNNAIIKVTFTMDDKEIKDENNASESGTEDQ